MNQNNHWNATNHKYNHYQKIFRIYKVNQTLKNKNFQKNRFFYKKKTMIMLSQQFKIMNLN